MIAAFNAAGREILNSPDGQEAYRRANELLEVRAGQEDLQAWLRAHGATWIKEAEHLSLAEMAERLGLSKSRIAQFVQAASEDRSGELER